MIELSNYSIEQQEQIKAVNESIEKLTKAVQDAEDLNKLYANETFKRVVLDGLFTEEVDKLTHSLAFDEHTPESEELIMVRLRSLKLLRNYLNGRKESGSNAKLALENEEKYKQELLNEMYGATE